MRDSVVRIGIIGRVASGVELYDGQTVKTVVLKDCIEKYLDNTEVICADTYKFKCRFLQIAIKIIYLFFSCDAVFVLLSRNGRNFLFPIIALLTKLTKVPVYHDAIGGRLADEVKKKEKWKKYLNSFRKNWVELPSLCESLKSLGISNAEYLPNFKNLEIVKTEDLDLSVPKELHYCTFSRVSESKGILHAIEAIERVNSLSEKKTAYLHIYGAIEEEFEDKLFSRISDNIIYEGKVSFNDSVKVLKNYFALLFPTTFIGEGFPGTIIDAFSAGIPVIASDWHFNSEIIKTGETGFCYDYRNLEDFFNIVKETTYNPSIVSKMKTTCVKEAKRYSSDVVFGQIKKQLEIDHII